VWRKRAPADHRNSLRRVESAQADRLGCGAVRRAALAPLLLVVALSALPGCGGDEDEAPTGAEAPAGGCKEAELAEPRRESLPAPSRQFVEQGEPATVVMETSCGTFEIELDTERAPKTANSFAYLVEKGFYDGLAFHRIVPDFVIQGGDPLGNGTGGPGYSVDEAPPPNLAYTRGVVAMAKTSAEPPGRSGSQFFVVTVVDAGLHPDFALVGRVSSGMDTVDRIAGLGTPAGRPTRPVVIEAAILRGG
jgi:cyclophilin family peptidyl-prolyl cis-trans isomerase